MKPKIMPWLATLLFLLGLSWFAACSPSANEKSGGGKTIYTCSMHPQVRQDKPGNCPICGMKLVPVNEAEPQPESTKPAPTNETAPQPDGMKPMPTSETAPHQDHQNAAPSKPQASVRLGNARNTVASIRTEAATERRFYKKAELFGEIAPIKDRQVNYTWFYNGRVQKVLADFNTTELKRDQPVLQVYSEEALAEQEAYLTALRERWLSTFYERDTLTARIATIQAKLARIGLTDADMKALVKTRRVQSEFILRTPISGSLISQPPRAGERFTSETTLFSVAPLEKVWFIADVYEKDLPMLQLGQEIKISSPARPDHEFQGKLVFIDRAADAQKRTLKARFEVNNPQRLLLPMLSATGQLKVDAGEAVTIPASAVIDTGKRKVVYVQTGEANYDQREVIIGNEGATDEAGEPQVAVASGLKSGEKVAVNGAFLIDAEASLQGGNSAHQH
ncbi:MAG: efflux RND transporter periplasmic adaptor subunit [bacterium]